MMVYPGKKVELLLEFIHFIVSVWAKASIPSNSKGCILLRFRDTPVIVDPVALSWLILVLHRL